MNTEIKLPELGENIEEGVVVSVLVVAGDSVSVDDSIVEIETDKATMEVPSPAAGVVKEISVNAGETVKVGQVLLILDSDSEAPGETPAAPLETAQSAEETRAPTQPAAPAAPAQAAPSPAPAPASRERGSVPAAPSVRRLAYEIGVEIADVPGSGAQGRITAEDVKVYSKQLHQSRGAARAGAPAGGITEKPLPDFSKWGATETVPMNNIRRVTSEAMAHNWSVIPHVTQFDKADITTVEAFRQQYKARVQQAGGKLTITSILVKILASALKEFPQFNSSADARNKQIVRKSYISIGVAVDTENGLLVPVIRDADKKSITEISIEMNTLSEKARNKKLTLEDMQGGTFTISNLGGIGGTNFTPIVNWPEVAILGIARSSHEPVFVDGKFEPRLIMPYAVSYDHRVIDGADGARFARFIDDALQNPMLLALDG
ncbi:MAG: 2-oxo acid dehydrogenase subunit E2 [Verrucomicrobia bacterium]|nr:2-oxo acid dehydrogenase subunit E2 [Verrucomicrobiota bacterium]MDA1087205.1 2-oxo acid dehydrogenase subunit E2 [Verrucomicrobiota bacterium]